MTAQERQLAHVKNTFAKNVLTLRERRGWLQADLATKAGVSRASIVRIEKGDSHPSFATACMIADALGVPIVEMRVELLDVG